MRLRCHMLIGWTWTLLVLDLVLVLVLTADGASAQTLVHVYEGDDALLPCTYPEGRPPPDVCIYWKDRQDNQVLTIHNNQSDSQNQSPEYQNRVRFFPDQLQDGTFSLVLMKVKGSDGGVFECHITPYGFQQNVRLNVTSKRGSGLPGSGAAWTGPLDGGSVAAPRLLLLLLLHLLLLLFCL